MTITESFSVDIGLFDESPTLRHIIIMPNESEDQAAEDQTESNNSNLSNPNSDSYENLLYSWAQSCLGFLDTFPMLLFAAHYLNHEALNVEFMEFIEKESLHREELNREDSNLKYIRYRLGKQHLDSVHRKVSKKYQYDRAEEAFSKAQLLAIVAEYEAFIADLLRLTIRESPESFIPSTQTVKVSTIIQGTDIEEIKESIIEDHIIDLQRGSHVDVIKTIYSQLKLSHPNIESLREFGEICLRRNALTHANGISNRVYRRDMKKLGFSDEEIPAEGMKLHINNHYMRRSIARVFQMGYFTAQIVWQHLRANEREEAVKLLINHSHDFLISGYTKICGRLCNFGLNPKSAAGEQDRAYLTINLALSSFLNKELTPQERKTEAQKALSKRDWSIVNNKFAMALCCINEEYDKFGDLFDKTKDDDFDANQFMSLAIFTEARNQPIFREKMLSHYGIEIKPNRGDDDNESYPGA